MSVSVRTQTPYPNIEFLFTLIRQPLLLMTLLKPSTAAPEFKPFPTAIPKPEPERDLENHDDDVKFMLDWIKTARLEI